MIVVKKINQEEIIVNCDLIEMVEFTPHAVMSLTTGEKLVVDETIRPKAGPQTGASIWPCSAPPLRNSNPNRARIASYEV